MNIIELSRSNNEYLSVVTLGRHPLLSHHNGPRTDPTLRNYCCCLRILHKRRVGIVQGSCQSKIEERFRGKFQSRVFASRYLKRHWFNFFRRRDLFWQKLRRMLLSKFKICFFGFRLSEECPSVWNRICPRKCRTEFRRRLRRQHQSKGGGGKISHRNSVFKSTCNCRITDVLSNCDDVLIVRISLVCVQSNSSLRPGEKRVLRVPLFFLTDFRGDFHLRQ